MELRIPVVELSRALSAAQGAVQRKNTMPILSHVLVNAVAGTDGAGRLTIAATDLDIGVRSEHPCEVLTAGAVTIPARALADMVRELPGPDVSLKRLPNQHVEVKSGRTRARLLALSADEFPPLPPYHEASFVALDTALLVDMVDKTLYASSQDETRYNLNGVLFEPPQSFKAGFPDEYEIGVDTRWKDKYGVWVVRNTEGIYALIAVCTNLGCTPNWLGAENKFKCPCHGSGFYRTGINFEGPAPRPLERYRISLAEDGQILVDKSKKFQQEKGEWNNPDSFLTL